MPKIKQDTTNNSEDKNKEVKNGTVFDDLDINVNNKNDNEKTIEAISEKKINSKEEELFSLTKPKIELVRKLLANIKENNEKLIQLLSGTISAAEEERISIGQISDESMKKSDEQLEEIIAGRIIEGVFDGENMIGPDGKQYSVPANYASKSKLVEGDILKLTITPNGTFVYKQIGPIERARIVGILEQDNSGNFSVVAEGKRWKVLIASVTYYKGRIGDEVIILVPQAGESKWAAVENIVRKVN